MIGGIISAAILMAFLTVMGQTTNLWVMRILMFGIGASMGHLFLPAQAAAFATITPSETGHASALSNTLRQVGSATGVALLSTIIGSIGVTQIAASGRIQPNLTAYHVAFIASDILVIVAICFASFIDDKAAAITMSPRRKKGQSEAVPEVVLSDVSL